MINNKQIASVLLGAAAAFAGFKYMKLSEEEKQKLADSLKKKLYKFKEEAESSVDAAKDYFADLKNKAGGVLKEHFPNAEKQFEEFFRPATKNEQNAGSDRPDKGV